MIFVIFFFARSGANLPFQLNLNTRINLKNVGLKMVIEFSKEERTKMKPSFIISFIVRKFIKKCNFLFLKKQNSENNIFITRSPVYLRTIRTLFWVQKKGNIRSIYQKAKMPVTFTKRKRGKDFSFLIILIFLFFFLILSKGIVSFLKL